MDLLLVGTRVACILHGSDVHGGWCGSSRVACILLVNYIKYYITFLFSWMARSCGWALECQKACWL